MSASTEHPGLTQLRPGRPIRGRTLLVVAAVLALGLGGGLPGCGSSAAPAPQTVEEQLRAAIPVWNQVFGAAAEFLGFSPGGTIRTQEEIETAFSLLTNPDTAWIPSGDLARPETVRLVRLADAANVTEQQLQDWRDLVRSVLREGQRYITLRFRLPDGQIITSLAVGGDNGIAYNSITHGVFLVEDANPRQGGTVTCVHRRFSWLWGSERGFSRASVTAHCDSAGRLENCTNQCEGSMQLGTHQENCEVTTQGRCCNMRYSLAVATPLVTISISTDNFTLQTTGIGSAWSISGSCISCCQHAQGGGGSNRDGVTEDCDCD